MMKYLALLLLVLTGCDSHEKNNRHLISGKDTIVKIIWEIHNGDTVSGEAIHVIGGDTIIEDFGSFLH